MACEAYRNLIDRQLTFYISFANVRAKVKTPLIFGQINIQLSCNWPVPRSQKTPYDAIELLYYHNNHMLHFFRHKNESLGLFDQLNEVSDKGKLR